MDGNQTSGPQLYVADVDDLHLLEFWQGGVVLGVALGILVVVMVLFYDLKRVNKIYVCDK